MKPGSSEPWGTQSPAQGEAGGALSPGGPRAQRRELHPSPLQLLSRVDWTSQRWFSEQFFPKLAFIKQGTSCSLPPVNFTLILFLFRFAEGTDGGCGGGAGTRGYVSTEAPGVQTPGPAWSTLGSGHVRPAHPSLPEQTVGPARSCASEELSSVT